MQVGTGMADLVFVPVQQYRRDGRLGHGLRQGVQSVTVETIDLAMLLFGGARGVLESVDSILYSRGANILEFFISFPYLLCRIAFSRSSSSSAGWRA